MGGTLFVMQGGGPTAVINATLAGVLANAGKSYDRVLGLQHSFEPRTPVELTPLIAAGATQERRRLARTPGAILGSSRKRVGQAELDHALKAMTDFDAGAIIGIGGNGTMTALEMLAKRVSAQGSAIQIVGVPKTVDNDIPGVEVAPGFGSAARFVALTVRDYGRDFRAMSTFDDVTIFETMGRNAGWLTAASAALSEPGGYPDLILMPEKPLDEERFLTEIAKCHARKGHVFVVVNEMLTGKDGALVGEAFQKGPTDSLGRKMYSLSLGTGNYLADQIWKRLGLQSRCLRPGSLGRALTCCVSMPDRALAGACGKSAVKALAAGHSGMMVTIDSELRRGLAPLAQGSGTRPVPDKWIGPDFSGPTDEFVSFCRRAIGPVKPLFGGTLAEATHFKEKNECP